MRMPGMNSINDEEPHFTDPKEEAKYWRNLAAEYSSRFVSCRPTFILSYGERMAVYDRCKAKKFSTFARQVYSMPCCFKYDLDCKKHERNLTNFKKEVGNLKLSLRHNWNKPKRGKGSFCLLKQDSKLTTKI